MHRTDQTSSTIEPEAPTSLWQELSGGTAGPVVKVAVSVGLAPLFAGAALLLSYLFALGGWGRSPWSGYTVPSDELIAVLMIAGGLAYLGAVAWIWTRKRPKHRSLWGAVLLTVGIAAMTILLGVLAEENLRGADEVVIGGLVCVAAGGVVLIWVQAARRYRRAVPIRDRQDGALDIRCPSCGYRMVGLHESRCPECGTAYTLDELLGRQHFLASADRARGVSAAPHPPPIPPPPTASAMGSPVSSA